MSTGHSLLLFGRRYSPETHDAAPERLLNFGALASAARVARARFYCPGLGLTPHQRTHHCRAEQARTHRGRDSFGAPINLQL